MAEEEYPPTLQNIIDQDTLKWIFVGGKGGVGKTTTSSSLATIMSKHRKKVQILSTDPAHNLSDAFDQQFSREPQLVKGFDNLYGMEVDPKVDPSSIEMPEIFEGSSEINSAFMSEMISNMPGIDEIMVFTNVMKNIEKEDISLVIFDTAPTGHTLKLLKFPDLMETGLTKLQGLKGKFEGMVKTFGAMMGGDNSFESMFDSSFNKMELIKKQTEQFKNTLQNPDLSTFIAVCQAEFFSVYETERLVQELANSEMDIRNIVVNMIVEPCENCKKCTARYKMQKKYLDQILALYDDFHITPMFQKDEEIRGVQGLIDYSKDLLVVKKLPELPK